MRGVLLLLALGLAWSGEEPPPAAPALVERIEQHGITWTFAAPAQAGRFANGDWWVVGPVEIVAISPAWDGRLNGSMVDPVPSTRQGYRESKDWKYGPRFDDDLRAKLPLHLSGVRSVVSTIGLQTPAKGGAVEGLDTAAVLTVLEGVPPADAFRPPYVAGAKPLHTLAQLRWERLPKLPRPEGVGLPGLRSTMQRVWLDHIAAKSNTGAAIHPRANMPPYYFPRQAADMALLVLLDIPERQELTVRLVQLGIDLHAVSLGNGDAWRAYGGFGNGRKWPILFAGLMLGEAAMLAPRAPVPSENSRTGTVDKFGEDGGTWFGQPTPEWPQGKPLWGNDAARQRELFAKLIVDDSSGGARDMRDPDGLRDGPNAGYREICSVAWVGPALAARLMGAEGVWNHPPFFAYVDRWVAEQGARTGVRNHAQHCWGSEFVQRMWQEWRPRVAEVAAQHAGR